MGVIDGQQRLTTLSLKALGRSLDEFKNNAISGIGKLPIITLNNE
jgi:uncharacterized protein with ParB-like and HNH nuclease domain